MHAYLALAVVVAFGGLCLCVVVASLRQNGRADRLRERYVVADLGESRAAQGGSAETDASLARGPAEPRLEDMAEYGGPIYFEQQVRR